MNWIKKAQEEKINKEIKKLTSNIEKNNILLGEKLFEFSKESNSISNNFGLEKSKIDQLINNFLFYKKYELKNDIGFTKLTLLTKIKDKSKIKESIEFAYKSNVEELKNFIFNKTPGKIINKNFQLDEDDELNFQIAKLISEKISDSKLNNSQILKYVLMDFISNNSQILNDEDNNHFNND